MNPGLFAETGSLSPRTFASKSARIGLAAVLVHGRERCGQGPRGNLGAAGRRRADGSGRPAGRQDPELVGIMRFMQSLRRAPLPGVDCCAMASTPALAPPLRLIPGCGGVSV